MRKLIYSLSVSLDGFVETLDRKIDWVIVDEELHTFFNDQAREKGAFLHGRRMYELMAEYWPTADLVPTNTAIEIDFARIWKSTPKIVFSKTLDKVAWNSRLVRDNAVEEIKKLKAQPGKDMDVGGATLAASCIEHGLVDEYQLFVNPVVLGAGTPFFPALPNSINLRLIETKKFSSGVVYLRYKSAEK